MGTAWALRPRRALWFSESEAMEYPSGFPQQCRAAIEAEELRASRDLEQATQSLPWSKSGPGEELEAEVRRYVLRIYAVFVQQACKPVCGWPVDRVRSRARQFLRMLTCRAWSEKGYDARGTVYPGQIRRLPDMTAHTDGAILPEVMSKFEESVQWRESENALLELAEAEALGASVRGQVVIPPVLRKRGRPAIPLETKRKAWDAKQRPGGTNKDAAKILYGTQHPTGRQIRNVPAILRYYQKRSLEMKKS